MKMQVIDRAEAEKLYSVQRGKYSQVYSAIEALELGKALVVECDTKNEVKKITASIVNMKYRGKANVAGCTVSKSGTVVVIYKN